MFSQMHPFYRALERHFQMSGSHSFAVLLGSMYPWSFPSSSPCFFGQPSIQSPLHHINGRVFFLIKPDNYISFSNFISFPLAISSLGFFSLHDDTWTFQSLTRCFPVPPLHCVTAKFSDTCQVNGVKLTLMKSATKLQWPYAAFGVRNTTSNG